MPSWAKVSIVLLLAVQAYTCAAFSRQENGWVTRHLKRPQGLEMRPSRHLGESTEQGTDTTTINGWRASLIHSTHKQGTENFTILQSIHDDVEISKERARTLDQRARNAPYKHHEGRMALDFTTDLHVTPGSYSMEISIGTPPQNFIAIADTGSDLVWLQCTPCDVCFESALFDPSLSSTYAPLGCGPGCDVLGNNELTCTPNCQYTYLYGDQSTTQGDFSLETITLNNTDGTQTLISEFQFGCGRRNNGTFSGTDGLVGLARGPISFPSQIAPALNNSVKFSYCLLSRYDPESERSPLLFGEAAVPTNLTGVNYTKILEPYNTSVVPYYYVQLLNITVGATLLEIPSSAFEIDPITGNGGTIFDSGTTYTILNTVAYQQVSATYKTTLDSRYTPVDMLELTGLEVCYDITGLDSVSIPNLTFNFEGADFDLPFENIMVLFTITGQDQYMCLAILESSGLLNIFGNVQQQNFQVLHDEDNLQIGWVEMDCKSL